MQAANPRSSSTTPSAAPPHEGHGLGITALVLASLFFLPLVPTVGLVLGIIALATGRSKPIAIVAVCLGSFFTLVTAVYAVVAIPAFSTYVRRAKELEARAMVGAITTRLQLADAQKWAALPDADWTPAGNVCAQPGHVFAAAGAAWDAEPWKTIGIRLDGKSHYQYRLLREAQGFRVEARGEPACDGEVTLLTAHVSPDEVSPIDVARKRQ